MIVVIGAGIGGLTAAAYLARAGLSVTVLEAHAYPGGWVGGFPQTSLLRSWPPRLAPGLWMVGDSIFPGESVAEAALGGLRVGASVLAHWGMPDKARQAPSPLVETSG